MKGKQIDKMDTDKRNTDSTSREQMKKLEDLKAYLKELECVAVAFSGGVDSAFLLKVAHEVLGEQAIAVTISSDFFPDREKEEAVNFCQREGICQIIYELKEWETEIEGFVQNPPDRCYLCKKEMLGRICITAKEQGIPYIVEGSNVDDEGDYRPGMKAIAELGIKSPLKACNMTKKDIRVLSKKLGLPTWEKPSFACLASRFVYGESITKEKLVMVDKAEQLMMELGFTQFRVRIHGTMARIEIHPEQFHILIEKTVREKIIEEFKKIGFSYISLDLAGYRQGSMNETLDKE